MRIATPPRLVLALAALAAVVATVPANATPTRASPATARVVVAPVTSAGKVAHGFKLVKQNDASVSCAPAFASPVAVSKNIEECSPSAAYAVACWKSANAGKVLCARDPRSKKVYQLKLSGRFALTPPVSAKRRTPFVVVLDDGDSCLIRIGGTGAILKSHPKDTITYYCAKDGAVWSGPNAAHEGVNESAGSWTVQTASGTGTGKLVTHHVTRAYFVATAA